MKNNIITVKSSRLDLYKRILRKIALFSMAIALISGCTSMQSMSSYARTGDTVTIALSGTEDSNALVEILKKEDINVTITDSSGSTYPVNLRHLFRVYPDHGSFYTYNTASLTNSWDEYAPVLLGQWLATVDLIDLNTSQAPLLAVGPATISVSSPSQLEPSVYYPTFNGDYSWTNGNLASIAIEILPGIGSPNNLNYLSTVGYDPISSLEPLPQIMVSPSAPPLTVIAGGSFTFVYNSADFSGDIIAVPSNHDPNIQLTSKITVLGNGSNQLEVMLLNPKGFLNHNERTIVEDYPNVLGIGKMSPLRSVRFSIVFLPYSTADNDTQWQNYIQMSGKYIDLQGYTVVDITPVMNKVR